MAHRKVKYMLISSCNNPNKIKGVKLINSWVIFKFIMTLRKLLSPMT